MPYDAKSELKRVKDYYSNDPLQKRFSALICGGIGSGKTYLARTARKPIHIDSFDPGGTKSVEDLIITDKNPNGCIMADTRWEKEDPYNPSVFKEWMRTTDIRIEQGYFDMFGTYMLDSLSTFGDAVMNYQLADPYTLSKKPAENRAGQLPQFRVDYQPQKINIINRIKKLMSLPCDFILTAHLKEIEEVTGMTKEGEPIKRLIYRMLVTGQAVITVPLQFDELYVILGKETSSGVEREMLVEAQGKYIARSRLRKNMKLENREKPDIKALLKKIGLNWEDKPKLEV